MNWRAELEELRLREQLAHEMGGADKVKRQHDGGRLTVRERIVGLVDAGSFHETGAIAGSATYDENNELESFTASNCVFGRARIDGRPVVVVGDDFTVRGGSADAAIHEKSLMAERMAAEFRLPIIRIIEGSGGGGSVKTIETKGRANLPGGVGQSMLFHYTSANMAVVPVVALGLGSVAGLGAARLAASHYSVMTNSSAMFVAGPPVVARIGQNLSKQELGGWEIQTRSGAVDHAVDSEEEAFACARRFLSYLPNSVHELPPRLASDDDPERRDESLMDAIPKDRRKVYKVRPIIEALVDRGSFFEMGAMFGRSIVAGLARLDGRAFAVMASDPYFYGGSWTATACQKIVRFVDLAETFHLPVVYLMDCPGFLIGIEAERAATIRHGVRAMAAINQTTVPWCTIIMRNCFGVAGAVHQPAGRLAAALRMAVRLLGPRCRSRAASRRPTGQRSRRQRGSDRQAHRDPAAPEQLRSPFRTAEAFWVEEIIDPRESRLLLCEFARIFRQACRTGPSVFPMRP